ncbi:alpha/beta hydrolase [Colwelliaceae bacterium 6471]
MKLFLAAGALVLMLLVSGMVAAALPESGTNMPNCIEINDDFSRIEHLMASGELRTANKVLSGQEFSFSYDKQQPYRQYLDYATNRIKSRNPQASRLCPIVTPVIEILTKQNDWTAITTVGDLIAPFELRRADHAKGILLIHGLTDSPYVFHELAAYFYQQGFNVRTLLIPGHGTAASDLIDVELEQWQQAASYAIERAMIDFDQVYLGGFSTGGTLILDYFMTHKLANNKVAGVFLWSPALKAKSNFAWLAKYVDYIPFVDWLAKEADIDFAKYESFPFNAAAQVNTLMERVVRESTVPDRIIADIPLFVVASEHDQTIATEATLALMRAWHDPVIKKHTGLDTIIYYGDPDRVNAYLPSTVNIIVPSCAKGELCQSVYDIAHTAPTNSPANAHYGVNGKYRNCSHYLTDMDKFSACKQAREVIVGERTEQNLNRNKVLKRLTYNPFFDEMLAEINKFLAKTSTP